MHVYYYKPKKKPKWLLFFFISNQGNKALIYCVCTCTTRNDKTENP